MLDEHAMKAARASQKLQHFHELLANPVWRDEIAPRLQAAFETHQDGVSQRRKTPAERAEHIEAFHLSAELRDFCSKRIAALQAEVRDYSRKAGAVDARIADAG